MKTKLFFFSLIVLGLMGINQVRAEEQNRDVPSFSEISMRVSGRVYLEQGDRQSVRVVASESMLDEIITEVKDRSLVIRFKSTNLFMRSFNPGKIEIYVTVPEINALSVSGSGDITADNEINTRILDLSVSGSGNIRFEQLVADRVKAGISGSGNVQVNDGRAEGLTVTVSGSGSYKGADFEVSDVDVRISGSGNCTVHAGESLKARVSGSGNVVYAGNPSVDTSVVGSGRVKKL
jgi:hypothetical protein